MAKPTPPEFPLIHPSTPVQQLRPMLEAYRKQVEAFYASLEQRHSATDQLGPLESWGTPWTQAEMTDEELKAELNSGRPSVAALALLRKKANL